jgi:hypothetical protein
VATAVFELAKVIVPGLLDVGAARVKSGLVVVYEELGNVRAPSVVADGELDINPTTFTGDERSVVKPSPTLPAQL